MKTLSSTIIIKNSSHYLSSISCFKSIFVCVLSQLVLKSSLSGSWGIQFYDLHFPEDPTEAGRGTEFQNGGKQKEGVGSPRCYFFFGVKRFCFQMLPTVDIPMWSENKAQVGFFFFFFWTLTF